MKVVIRPGLGGLILLAGLGLAAMVFFSAEDIRRYLRIRNM